MKNQTEYKDKMEQKYKLRYRFDYASGGCLWAADDRTLERFGPGAFDEEIPALSAETLKEIELLQDKFETILNPYDTDLPPLWLKQDCEIFNHRIDQLLKKIRAEIGEEFEIIDRQLRMRFRKDFWKKMRTKREHKGNWVNNKKKYGM